MSLTFPFTELHKTLLFHSSFISSSILWGKNKVCSCLACKGACQATDSKLASSLVFINFLCDCDMTCTLDKWMNIDSSSWDIDFIDIKPTLFYGCPIVGASHRSWSKIEESKFNVEWVTSDHNITRAKQLSAAPEPKPESGIKFYLFQ